MSTEKVKRTLLKNATFLTLSTISLLKEHDILYLSNNVLPSIIRIPLTKSFYWLTNPLTLINIIVNLSKFSF